MPWTPRRAMALAALATLTLATPGVAAGTFHDGSDAAPGLDLRSLHWNVTADAAHVEITLAAAADPAAAYTAVLFIGEANASLPTEWYLVHHGPGGATVLAGHADPVREVTPDVRLTASRLVFDFPRVDAAEASCEFAVAAVTVREDGEDVVRDSLPDRDRDLGAAWRAGQYCWNPPVGGPALHDHDEEPAVGPGGLFAVSALAAVALAARVRRD